MKKIFDIPTLESDPALLHILSFLNLSELQKLKQVSHYFQKKIHFFLNQSQPYKQTQEIIHFIAFITYFKNLHADFPKLKEEIPPALPYLKTEACLTPPKFSIFHGFFNFLSSYPTESEEFDHFSSLRDNSNVAYLREKTKRIDYIVSTYLNTLDPDPQHLASLSRNLLRYKKRLSAILNKNEKTFSRSSYFDHIKFRRHALMTAVAMLLKFSSNDLFFSKNTTFMGTLRVLGFLSIVCRLLDKFMVTDCKAHLKKYYPGLRLNNAFLENRLTLFNRFIEKSETIDDITEILHEKFAQHAPILKEIMDEQAAAANDEIGQKPINLFFHYQHHHHPHAFWDKSNEKASRKQSVDSIDTIYAHCYKKEQKKLSAIK